MVKLWFFFICFGWVLIGSSQIRINEFASSNTSGLKDEDGDYSDWIELYNSGENKINLKDYSLSDGSQPQKWSFPRHILKPGGFVIVYASNKNRKKKSFHTNFEISKKGESLFLYNPKGEIIDEVQPTPLSKNTSFARVQDGTGYFQRTEKPSPKKSNKRNTTIVFSKTSGFYSDNIYLELSTAKSYEIRYTLDCSPPTNTSQLYSEPILITNQISDSSDIGYIKASHEKNEIKKPYQKATVIRAALFKNGNRISRVFSHTYFISPEVKERYAGIDVISLVMDPYDLFDHDTGIYAMGKYHDLKKKDGNYFRRGSDWEREGDLTYFDNNGEFVFSQNIGVRIHGGLGRKKPQKSFRLYARKKYNAPYINYPFFENRKHRTFKKVILRSSLGCWSKTMIKDEVISDLCKDLNVDVLESRPAIVFLNGNYWGLYSIRERFDENYIASNYEVDKKDVNILIHGFGKRRLRDKEWGIVSGNPKTHTDLYAFLEENSLDIKSNYEHVSSVLNIASIADYYCIQLFINNKDWPTNNNKLWSVGDGKWSQVLYDTDAGCMEVKTNTLDRLMGHGKVRRQFAPYAIFLFKKLVESEEFVQLFSNRMAFIMNTVFNEENVEKTLNKFIDRYQKYVQENALRWSIIESESNWLKRARRIKSYCKSRPKYIVEFFKTEFDVDLNNLSE